MSRAVRALPGAKDCDRCGGRIVLRRSQRGSWYAVDVALDSGTREEVAAGLHYGTCANAVAARERAASQECPWCHTRIACPDCGERGPVTLDRAGREWHGPCGEACVSDAEELLAFTPDHVGLQRLASQFRREMAI